MSNTNSFWNHPIEKIEEALHIRKQIEALQTKLSQLIGDVADAVVPSKGRGNKPATKGIMSADARARIGAAVKKRWADKKTASSKVATAKAAPKPAKSPKKKGGLTPEGRAKLAAAMKARWAAKKKAGA